MPMTRAQFAAEIKRKYPQYAKVPDDKLVDAVLAKYPIYGKQLTDSPTQATKAMDETANVWRAFPDKGKYADLLTDMEGGRGNTVATANNNPGNLKDPTDKTGKRFQKFGSYEEGRQALLRQMDDWRRRFPDMTIDAFNRRYAGDESMGGDNANGTVAGRNRRMLEEIGRGGFGGTLETGKLPPSTTRLGGAGSTWTDMTPQERAARVRAKQPITPPELLPKPAYAGMQATQKPGTTAEGATWGDVYRNTLRPSFRLGNVTKGVARGGLGALKSIYQLATSDPQEFEQLIKEPAKAEWAKAVNARKQGRYMEMLAHGAAAGDPLGGPWAAQLGERIGSGDIGGGLGELGGGLGVSKVMPGSASETKPGSLFGVMTRGTRGLEFLEKNYGDIVVDATPTFRWAVEARQKELAGHVMSPALERLLQRLVTQNGKLTFQQVRDHETALGSRIPWQPGSNADPVMLGIMKKARESLGTQATAALKDQVSQSASDLYVRSKAQVAKAKGWEAGFDRWGTLGGGLVGAEFGRHFGGNPLEWGAGGAAAGRWLFRPAAGWAIKHITVPPEFDVQGLYRRSRIPTSELLSGARRPLGTAAEFGGLQRPEQEKEQP